MALTPKIANVCRMLGSQHELFQETDAFRKAISDLLKTSIAASGDLAHLRSLAVAIDDKIILEEAFKGLKGPDAKKLLKVVDPHWGLPKGQNTSDLHDRLIRLAVGQIDAALDQTQHDRESKQRLQILVKAKDIAAARAVLAQFSGDAAALSSKLTEAQQRTLVKRFDKHHAELASTSPAQIAAHLQNLLTTQIEPAAPPEKPKSVRKPGKKPTRSDPMKTTVMSAKWDGIDRD